MTALLETIRPMITPALVAQIGQKLGMEPQMVEQGAAFALPMLLGGVSRKLNTTSGATDLMDMLSADDGAAMTNLTGLVDQFAPGMGEPLIKNLFGDGFSTIQSTIKQQTGIDIGPITMMMAPVVMSMVSNYMRTNNLNVNGLSAGLKAETDKFLTEGGERAVMLQSAFTNMDQAQKLKTEFSTNEWSALMMAPVAVAMLIIGAAPSGNKGVGQEIEALERTTRKIGMEESRPGGLLNTLLAGGIPTDKMDAKLSQLQQKGFTDLEPTLLNEIKQARNILTGKVPDEDIAEFKAAMTKLAQAVAEGAKEGGFFGIGGQLVSDAETAMIGRITEALNG